MAEAKTKKAAAAPEKSGPPATTPSGLPAVPFDYGDDAGVGFENVTQDDTTLPFLGQLQAISEQVAKNNPKYVPGAEPGMFHNTVTDELLKGPVFLVPCVTDHNFVEWVPRKQGGGFRGTHEPDSDIVKKARETAAGSLDLKTPDGNDLVETFYIYALVLDGPDAVEPKGAVVLSFAKTKIRRYKELITRLRTVKGAAKIPLFAHRLEMASTEEKGPEGPYFNVKLRPAIEGDVTKSLVPATLGGQRHPLLEAGRALRDAVAGGTKKADFNSLRPDGAAARDEVF